MTRIGWWNCQAGVSGDMLLGAIVAAGVPVPVLQAAVDSLGVALTLSAGQVSRGGVPATQVVVSAPASPSTQTSRRWAQVRELVSRASLADAVKGIALDAFARLARAEAAVHRVAEEDVHFHEVGALDALADIVGAAAGLVALGVDRWVSSPIATGVGATASAHGALPVPAPAVIALLAEAGAPAALGGAPVELATPTGVAVLAATVTGWGDPPLLRPVAQGYGAGSREVSGRANVLQLVIGEQVAEGAVGEVVVEANVDDLDPRLWPDVLSRLLTAGAADAWLTPIVMKKGRPAHTVHVLAEVASVPAVRTVLFAHTSTIGVREHGVAKYALARELVTVDVAGRPVRVKVARLDGAIVGVSPEFDDVAAVAAQLDRPAKAVLAAAIAAADAAGWRVE